MYKILIVLLMLMGLPGLQAGEKHLFRDRSGQLTGSASLTDNRVIYRDARGRNIDPVSHSGQRQIYRDAAGRLQGSVQQLGKTTV